MQEEYDPTIPPGEFETMILAWAPRIAVGLVLVTMAVLVALAILSFINVKPLDAQPAAVIKRAADAAASTPEG